MSTNTKVRARITRHRRVRKAVTGIQERPRLAVFRSNRHIYAQLIDDTSGRTLVAASSLDEGMEKDGDKKAVAKRVGESLGRRAKEQGVTRVVFDRGGRLYHGRVAALAEGARDAGLEF